MAGLTDKQKRFCEEYIIDLNGAQSAIRAGYAEGSARVEASRLLSNDNIQDYISTLQKNKSEELNISQNMVLKELMKIAFGDVKNYFDDLGRLIDINELENNVSASIKSVTVLTEKTIGGGEFNIETNIKKLESYDKLKALDTINKMLGFYEKDNNQKKPINNINLKDAISFD